ncbi:unnamed protein product [Danaus chrysippus]|uniref:(African queen) hypothetical protein n=1 Tax=Danaus chrysippus TaxID=151541 RepID=A0A8J2VQM2_9NEOP|nr:unnamed protein product [Danaus chrysippus]
MVRLPILLLVVSTVLTTVYSIDNDVLNTTALPKSEAKQIYSVIQRRRHQVPHEEIKEVDGGRYFRRPPRTTTVPSIFSMKVEKTYQHVYPDVNSSDKQIHPKQNHTNEDYPRGSSKPSIKNIPTERVTLKTRNLSRRIPFAGRSHPAVAQPMTSFNDHHQEEDKVKTESTSTTTSTTTTSTTTSTTPEPVVLETTEMVQVRKESVEDSQNLDSFPSKNTQISPNVIAEIQKSEEFIEKNVTTTTSTPISTTTKKLEETEFVPTSVNVPNIISHTRRRRPHFATRVHSQPIKETLTVNDNVALSTSAPTVNATTATEQEKKKISPSYELDLPAIVKKPKLRRRLLNRDSVNRRSQKLGSDELRKQQTDTSLDEILSSSTQGIPSTLDVEKSASLVPMTSPKPPPVPTLSPWYDGFGK